MRKLLILFILCAAFMMGSGLAQGRYAGVSIGTPTLQGYYGLGEGVFIDNADTRIRLALGAFGGFGFEVGADLLFDGGVLDDEGLFTWYYGFGPGLGFYNTTIGGFDYSALRINATGLGGVEYAINENFSAFGEVGAGLGIRIGTGDFVGVNAPSLLYLPVRVGIGAKFFL